MRLLAKFNLILLVVFGLCGVVISHVSYTFLIGNARDQVLREAQLMMSSARAVRDYISDDVSPLIQENPRHRVRFLPEAVPFFGAKATFEHLRREYPDYTYKEAALNPTNPEDRAADWEADIVRDLRDHPDESQASGVRDTPMGGSLYLAHPIRAKQECLECHGVASAAPKGMLAVYGPNNGFGWKNGEIIGAQVVSVPLSVPLGIGEHAYHRLIFFLVCTFLCAMLALDAGVFWFVIRPLRLVSDTADRVSRGEKNVPPVKVGAKDEIGVVAASFNRMQVSLQKALKMIDPN